MVCVILRDILRDILRVRIESVSIPRYLTLYPKRCLTPQDILDRKDKISYALHYALSQALYYPHPFFPNKHAWQKT